MAKRQKTALSFPIGFLPHARLLQILLLAGAFLLAISLASAQTSQQFVYASAAPPGASTSVSVVAGFSKAGQTGTLALVPGSPFNERLEGGLMAVDGQGKFLFVLNPVSDDISMFQIDQVTGALAEVPGSPFAVPPLSNTVPPPSQPLSIATERSGKFLFVSYFLGDGQSSSVVSLAIDTSGSSPALRTIENTVVGNFQGIPVSPVQLLTDSKGLHLYVGLSSQPNGVLTGGFGGAEVYSIDSATGNLSYQGMAGVIPSFGRDYAIDPQDRFFYAGGGDVDFVVSCIISPVDGTANNCSPISYLGFSNVPSVMLIESSGHFLYIPQGTTPLTVAVYSIDQNTGALTLAGPSPGISLAQNSLAQGSFIADPMGPHIYAAELSGPPAVYAYQVDQQTGNLTQISGSPFNPAIPSTDACCQALAISGNSVQAISGPAATIFPSSASPFSATSGTSSATQVFRIVNIGNQLLAINSISIAGTNASSFSQTNTCAATLAPNANCSVSITFTPPTAGNFTAALQVADNAPSSPQTLGLTGVGAAPQPAITFSPTAPSFPATTQGTSSSPQTLTIMSTGTGPLHISSISLSGPNPSDFSFTNNCTAPVAPGSSCTVSLVFSPIAPGQRAASLLVSDDASGSPQTVSVSATANPAFTAGAVPGSSLSASVSAGQTAQYQLQLTPGAGFSGTLSLICAGAPLAATCQVPSTVSVSSGAAATFTVTVKTTGSAALLPLVPFRLRPLPQSPIHLFRWLALRYEVSPAGLFSLLVLVPLLVLVVKNLSFARNHRTTGHASCGNRLSLSSVLAALICALALINVAGCGGGAASVPPPPPITTPPGTSALTITLAGNSASGQPLQLQPIQLTLTVN